MRKLYIRVQNKRRWRHCGMEGRSGDMNSAEKRTSARYQMGMLGERPHARDETEDNLNLGKQL